jgi:hypothetical protein
MVLYRKFQVRQKIPPFSGDQWKTFENFCCDIFRMLWNNPHAQLNGRLGQPQYGVDVFGDDYSSGRDKRMFVGVQCKCKTGSSGKDFIKEIEAEAKKAEKFKPGIQAFVLAATLHRDSAIQESLNKMNIKREKAGKFPVYVKFWEDLIDELTVGTVHKYFPGIVDCALPFTGFDELIDSDRRVHPNREDFENDLYYKNDRAHQEIGDKFSKGNKCMLLGKPARGKTSVALGYSYFYLKEKNEEDERERQVFYLDALKNKDIREWKKQLQLFDYSFSLFIIDNCHLSVDEVNDLVSWWARIKYAKILLVSRSIHPDKAGLSQENYLELLQEEERVVEMESDETVFAGIVSKYKFFSKKSDDEVGHIEEVFKKCGGNLYLLYLFILTWRKKKDETLSNVESRKVLNDIYRVYLKDGETQEAFLKIAALYQFEIPVEKKYIGTVLENKKGLLKEFTEPGEKPAAFFAFFHPTIAGYVLEAAHKKGDLFPSTVEEYTFDILMDYISFKPANFFQIFKSLYQNGEIDLEMKIFKEETTLQVFEQIVANYSEKELISSLRLVAVFLNSIWRDKDRETSAKAVEYSMRLKKRLDKKNTKKLLDLYDFRTLNAILMLARMNKEYSEYAASIDYEKLGAAARDEHLGSINFFLYFNRAAEPEKIEKFISTLDFRSLGERSKEMSLSTIKGFIEKIYQTGVEKQYIREFCAGLDFRQLGERSKDVGLATIMRFIQIVSQSGVEKQYIREFCAGLEFRQLGERSKDVGLSTIRTFVENIYQSGVEKQYIREFCTDLDFKQLGERSKDVGLATINVFINVVNQAEVKRKEINNFCSGIGFSNLGSKFKPIILDNKEVLLKLNLMLNYLDRESAVEFVNGLGWDTIKKAIDSRFSPDELMLIDRLLAEKCRFDIAYLSEQNIQLQTGDVLFHSFIKNRRSYYPHLGHQKIQDNYICRALNRIEKDKTLAKKIGSIKSLKEWTNLIFNTKNAAPHFIRDKLVPVLRKIPAEIFERMFVAADIKTIRHFLDHFNPFEPLFTWEIPAGIRFQEINFLKKIKESSLVDTANFVFNFFYINRPDCCFHFAVELDSQDRLILSKAGDEEIYLRDIDFFLWNLWMALPANQVPSILNHSEIADIILKKSKNRNEKKEDLLSIIGIYYLSKARIPQALCRKIDLNALGDIEKLIKDKAYKGLRIMAGYFYLTKEKINQEFFNSHFDFIINNQLDIPNQKVILETFLQDIVEK